MSENKNSYPFRVHVRIYKNISGIKINFIRGPLVDVPSNNHPGSQHTSVDRCLDQSLGFSLTPTPPPVLPTRPGGLLIRRVFVVHVPLVGTICNRHSITVIGVDFNCCPYGSGRKHELMNAKR